jgi:hypothetical protein
MERSKPERKVKEKWERVEVKPLELEKSKTHSS